MHNMVQGLAQSFWQERERTVARSHKWSRAPDQLGRYGMTSGMLGTGWTASPGKAGHEVVRDKDFESTTAPATPPSTSGKSLHLPRDPRM